MLNARAAVMWAALALLALGAIACNGPTSRPDGWRRAVFYPGNLDAKIVWAHQITDREPMDFQPLEDGGVGVFGDSIYIGGRSKTLYRLDRFSGKTLAKLKTSEEIFSTPLITDRFVYFGSSQGAFLALNRLTLKEVWRFDVNAEVVTQPIIVDGIVYFLTQTDTLTALDANSGRFMWEHKEQFHGTMSIRRRAKPAIVDGVVYNGFTNGNVCALDAKTGKLIWRRYIGKGSRFDDVNASPVIEEGMVYTASFDNGVYCLDAKTGLTLWNNPIKSASSAVVIGNRLYITASESGFYCLDVSTGSTEWFIELKELFMEHREGALSAPVRYQHDYLVFSASGTGLYFVNFRDQRLVTRFTPGHGVSSAPTVSGDFVFALSNGGWIYNVALAPKKAK
jgi:outer membrane protein assembly factor BamB